MKLNEEFWEGRYKANNIGWDLGEVSPPLKAYFNQLDNKELRILIPGGGNSYEAEYLYNNDFKNVFVVDISKTALNNLVVRVPNFPKENLIHSNFFDINLKFDLVIEQTFFCALNPILRSNYVSKIKDILSPNGKLVGLLFNEPLNSDKPPFGGSINEYMDLFTPFFIINKLEESYNSIESRSGKELFVNLVKM